MALKRMPQDKPAADFDQAHGFANATVEKLRRTGNLTESATTRRTMGDLEG
ncbi:MAG TPA: hypothetical protein VKZ99_07810 [Gammaproteobacteria bacterium]|nr:hypothetical protein [Gammaproteobacteria bacterium]